MMKSKTYVLALALASAVTLTARPAAAQLSNPNGLSFDSSGNLWVANNGANNVLELSATNGAVLNTITQGISKPNRLAFDSTGNLWVTNDGNSTVTEYNNLTTTGASLVDTITVHVSNPLGIAVDAYGDVYVANNSANSVTVYNIGGSLVETLTGDNSGFAFSAPGALAIHGQNIYAGFGPGSGTNAVISYNVGEFLTGDPAEITVYNDNVNTGPTGIAFDAEGNVYISCLYSGTWVRYAPSGGSPSLVVSQGVAAPEGIALNKKGDVFVSNAGQNNISVYSPTGAHIRTLD